MMKSIGLSIGVALLMLTLCGCKQDEAGSRVMVDELAAKMTPGMSISEVKAVHGEPDEIVEEDMKALTKTGEKKTGKPAFIYRYKKVSEFHELWVRFADDKVTWAMSYEKSSKLHVDKPQG